MTARVQDFARQQALASISALSQWARAFGLSPDRARAFDEALSAAATLVETGSRRVTQEHLRRGHEVLAQALHDEQASEATERRVG